MRTETFNLIHKGAKEPDFHNEKLTKVLDNGVPGPGSYNPKDDPSIPNFKMSKPSPVLLKR